jgi:hypothetical protein
MTAERRGTAYHEAGHAVVAVALGEGVKRVSIAPDETTLGRVHRFPIGQWFQPDVVIDGRTRRRLETDVMVLWAGTLAEERAAGVAADEDLSAAADDFDRIVDLAEHACRSERETRAYIEWLRLRSLGLLNRFDVWASIEAVVAVLMAETTISGRRLREVIAATRAEVLGR